MLKVVINVGRLVAGLDALLPQFACTTPYFRIRDGSDDTCIAEEIDDVLKTYFTFEIPIALTDCDAHVPCCSGVYQALP